MLIRRAGSGWRRRACATGCCSSSCRRSTAILRFLEVRHGRLLVSVWAFLQASAAPRIVLNGGGRECGCLLAKIDEPWSIDPKIGVLVDEQSTGCLTIEALSRPGAATSSATPRCEPRTRYVVYRVYLDDMRCLQHLILTSILPHF